MYDLKSVDNDGIWISDFILVFIFIGCCIVQCFQYMFFQMKFNLVGFFYWFVILDIVIVCILLYNDIVILFDNFQFFVGIDVMIIICFLEMFCDGKYLQLDFIFQRQFMGVC